MLLSEASLQRLAERSGDGITRRFSAAVRGLGRPATRHGRVGVRAALDRGGTGHSAYFRQRQPVRWFKSGSEVRQATTALNELFGGTYNANLVAFGG